VLRKVAAGLPDRRLAGSIPRKSAPTASGTVFAWFASMDAREQWRDGIHWPHRVGKYGVDVAVIDALAASS